MGAKVTGTALSSERSLGKETPFHTRQGGAGHRRKDRKPPRNIFMVMVTESSIKTLSPIFLITFSFKFVGCTVAFFQWLRLMLK